MTDQALEHVKAAQIEARKVKGIASDTALREINSVGVVGAGTMGGGIAMNFANVGIPVKILEVEPAALERGLGVVRGNYERSQKRGKVSIEDMEQRISLISGTLDYEDLGDADLVIEAVFENMDIKEQVFSRLDQVCKKGAILASNTSTLDVDKIASFTSRPEDVVGLHFFSPANVMKLLEIVRGAKTADDVMATVMDMAHKINKIGVVSGVCYGFIGNRMMESYIREACFMLLEGATPSQIDKALTDFGWAMGILNVSDVAGVDVSYRIHEGLKDTAEWRDDKRYGLMHRRLYEMGRVGLKAGAGFYDYEEGSRTPIHSQVVQDMIEEQSRALGVERREISDQEIIERCIYPLINEGADIIDEAIAQCAGDVDIVYIYGYGFPAGRGGPMYYAGGVGLDVIGQKIEEYRQKDPFGALYWKASDYLLRLGAEGKTFFG